MTDGPPLVFAHRGASAVLPEHTREAYLEAIAQGVDGLECDVRLTRDGELVCIHDAQVDRTSNGKGRVSGSTLDELHQYEYSSWKTDAKTSEAKTSEAAKPGILTLDELITIALAAGRPLRLLIETKHPSRYGSVVEEQLVALLRRYGLTTPAGVAETGLSVAVMSFSPLAVRRMRALAPDVAVVYLFELMPPAVREGRAPFGANLLGPGLAAVRSRPDIVRRAQERGHEVYVWTVNERSDIDLMLSLEVDGIISDRPADVLERLARTRPQ
jgi:glycerophosphoryl diester phosphodiesterase